MLVGIETAVTNKQVGNQAAKEANYMASLIKTQDEEVKDRPARHICANTSNEKTARTHNKVVESKRTKMNPIIRLINRYNGPGDNNPPRNNDMSHNKPAHRKSIAISILDTNNGIHRGKIIKITNMKRFWKGEILEQSSTCVVKKT